jgi:hypothetical protein
MMNPSTIGATDDYFSRQFLGFTPKNWTAAREHKIVTKDTKVSHRPAKAQRTFRRLGTTASISAPAAEAPMADVDYVDVTCVPTKLDDVRGEVRSFAELAAGWDGPDSSPALPGVIDDALEVLQSWSREIGIPEPEMAFEGTVALELYDEEGFSRGGVEFKGNHRAIYTVISKTKILSSGTFNASLLSEIIKSVQCIQNALSTEK